MTKSNDASSDANVNASAQLVVYSRAECHLCQEMILALQQLQKQIEFTFEVVDIDTDPELASLYNVRVPVLMALNNQQEICHYQLDVEALKIYLTETC